MASSVGSTRVAGMLPTLVTRGLHNGSMGDYQPADDRYDAMDYRYCGRSGLSCRPVARPVAELRHRPARGDPARDPAPRLRPRRDALRPGQQLRAAVRPGRGELRALPARRLQAPARRAGDLHQGRLRHVAGAVRPGRRLAEVRALLARPVAGADGPGLRRHLLQPPLRPRDAVEETMGALDTAVRSGRALYAGISSYSPGEDARGRHDRPRAGHAAADPPAVVLDAEPLDRGGPARRARGAGDGLHRVHAAGPGAAHRPLPRRRPRGLARGAQRQHASGGPPRRGHPAPRARAQRDRAGAWPEARPARAAVGAAGSRGSPRR